MKVYRYEHSDGGGPFCTFNGLVRGSPDNLIVDDDCLYGCESIDKLNEYFDMEVINGEKGKNKILIYFFI